MNLQTLKGFRDFLPTEKRKRDFVLKKIIEIFERFGFEPLETPTLEYAELLLGKYGAEADKLVYTFNDKGERKVGLRYDQTVPTARVLAQYGNNLPKNFRRYQVQNVFRADKPQKGRFREFTQCDADIFESNSPLADAEIIVLVYFIFKNIGFKNIEIKINDRELLISSFNPYVTDEVSVYSIIQSLDKWDKIQPKGVTEELLAKGLSLKSVVEIVHLVSLNLNKNPSEKLKNIMEFAIKLGAPKESLIYDFKLARGLDYYTGMIFEVILPEYNVGSCGGGGRYDRLIGQLGGVDIPAVGFGLGFDRMVEAADELKLFPEIIYESAKVLVTIFNNETLGQSLSLSSRLRSKSIKTELWVGDIKDKNPLEKQLKYADEKGIPFVLIVGPEEIKSSTVTLKNLQTREQSTVSFEELLNILNQ